MDFYAAQDLARRNSRLLLFAFISAVAVLIGITNLLVAFALYFQNVSQSSEYIGLAGLKAAFSWEQFGFISLAVTSTVFIVVLFKWAQLSAGGKSVAERLGGQRILPHTENRDQRRCLNVVEEMALAAGLPVPPVYVLPQERGINAFAAGVSPADAVIGITQGSLERFNREQLQGVIAHEYSHILNGDMRLNIRLAALLKGITFIGDVGEMILRGGRRNRRHTNAEIKVSYPTLVAGIGLYLVGLLGGLFAGLIKAAVSRQRELLADASAVQFTRNPQGVADALKVIGGHIPGSVIAEVRANELSHIFFGQIGSPLLLWFKTHPPLPDRIRRIEPDWDGQYIQPDRDASYKGTTADQLRQEARERAAKVALGAVVAGAVLGGAEDADFAADVLVVEQSDTPAAPEIPESLSEQAHDPFGSHAVVMALLLAADEDVREAQFQLVQDSGVRGLATTTRQLYPEIAALAPALRLSLLELSLPALKCMSPPQYRTFKETLLKITRADNKVDLYEWCLYQVVRHYLDPEFVQVAVSKPRYRKPVHVRQAYRTVLSVLAWHGHDNDDDRNAAFTRGVESVGLYNLKPRPLEECGVSEFSKAVNQLADCYPLLKPRLLKGMALCASHDDELSAREVEILVAVAAVMDCPVPASIRANPLVRD